jgi:lysophospholipase L1-like esterase
MKLAQTCVLLCGILLIPRVAAAQGENWVTTWATSPEPGEHDAEEPLLHLENQTVRERVRVSIGGGRIRLRLSNEFGTTPLRVGAVTVGVPADAASVKAGSFRNVTFAGRSSVTIPAGAPMVSDAVDFPVAFGSEISVTLYFPERLDTPTWHGLALKRSVVSARGDHTRDEKLAGGTFSDSSIAVTAVLVPGQAQQRVVVAFGDSVVDGDESTPELDRGWPSDLARRFSKTDGAKVAVVNAGIAGNRLLRDGPIANLGVSGLARFDRDALAQAGVTHIVLLEGLNDISFPGAKLGSLILADPADVRTAEDVIGAYRQLILRAHSRGVKLIGATLNPCEGVVLPGYYSPAKEETRQAVNKWIRESGEFDGVVDFDAVLRDPEHPSRLVARFASEDHLHPNDAGYQAMADAIDLALFK